MDQQGSFESSVADGQPAGPPTAYYPSLTPPEAPAPVPLPLAQTLTGAGGATGRPPTPSRRRTILAISIAAAVLLLLVAAAGLVALTRVGAPMLRHAKIGADLGRRVVAEYPGFRATALRSQVATAPTGGLLERCVYVDLVDRKRPAFRASTVYWAPITASKADAFTNGDAFFRTPVSPSQPVDSFEEMWVREHPDTKCVYVQELGESSESTRSYEVGFVPTKGATGLLKVFLAYGTNGDVWIPITSNEALTGDSTVLHTPPMIGSAVDTPALVAQVFPNFEVYRDYREPTGRWSTIMRDRDHHGLMLAEEVDLLLYEGESDPEVVLFSEPSARTDSFIRTWTSRHSKSVITFMEADPDMTGENELLDVTYASLPKGTPFLGEDHYARLRYHPATNRWTWEKVPY